MKHNWGDACNSTHKVAGCPMALKFHEFLEMFWICFGAGNVLEKIHFFRLVLELFLNSEFLIINFLVYNISGCPLFGSLICDKILFQFCTRQP